MGSAMHDEDGVDGGVTRSIMDIPEWHNGLFNYIAKYVDRWTSSFLMFVSFVHSFGRHIDLHIVSSSFVALIYRSMSIYR